MNKLVYLHELDSVRTSEAEIEAARKVLYDEIVLKGNTVVITFNQLADSQAFLGLAMESTEMLAAIKGLMLSGAIKVSRYSDKRTASQYLQDSLQPSPSGAHGKFVLSGWGIPSQLNIEERESIRDSIYRALRNSDKAILDLKKRTDREDLSALCEPGTTITLTQYNGAIERMQRLVDLMLAISNSNLAYVDVNTSAYPRFKYYLSQLLLEDTTFISEEAKALIRATQDQLQPGESRNRSPYYRLLEKTNAPDGDPSSEAAQEATRALDVCYNLTTEASIRNISAHYSLADDDSFASELQSRLNAYQESYATLSHAYPWAKERALAEYETDADPAQWQHALRLRKAAQWHHPKEQPPSSIDAPDSAPRPLYETHADTEILTWRAHVRKALTRNILIMVLYAVILSFVEVIISLVQDMMVGWMNLGNDSISDIVSDQGSIVAIVIFLVGIIIFSRSQEGNRRRNRRVLIAFLGVLFVIVLPVLSCVEITSTPNGFSLVTDFASLPDMLIMGIPNLVASLIGVALFAYIGWLLEEKLSMPGIIDSAVAALSSARDLVTFANQKAPSQVAYVNEATREMLKDGILNELNTVPEGPPYSHAVPSLADSASWNKYCKITEDDKHGIPNPSLEVIKDHAAVLEFERDPEGRPIGIMYSSPYNQLVVDLVQDKAGKRFAYERIIPTNKDAVVIIPFLEGKYVLLRQFRHALRDYQLSFPRGYGEPDTPAVKNAAKELNEELGVSALAGFTCLGTVVADSGLSGNEVAVFACSIDKPTIKRGYEGIEGYEVFTPAELDIAISEGLITDGFTLSALTLLRCKGSFQESAG